MENFEAAINIHEAKYAVSETTTELGKSKMLNLEEAKTPGAESNIYADYEPPQPDFLPIITSDDHTDSRGNV